MNRSNHEKSRKITKNTKKHENEILQRFTPVNNNGLFIYAFREHDLQDHPRLSNELHLFLNRCLACGFLILYESYHRTTLDSVARVFVKLRHSPPGDKV